MKFTKMSLRELTAHYNERAEKPVRGFRSKPDAIKAIKKLKPVRKSKAKSKSTPQSEKKGRTHTFGEAKITHVEPNPRREGTSLHAHYKAYRKGRTADQVVEATLKAVAGSSRRRILDKLHLDVKAGNVVMG